MHQEKSAEGEIDGLWESEVLSGLGDSEYLCLPGCSGSRGDGVSGEWIAVDGVDATGTADEARERDGDVAGTGTDVDTRPSRAESEAVECRSQWPAIDIVSKTKFGHVVRVHWRRS
jgi:hypothetical protein